jgi:ABC-type oligopeptide transport system ATPase subunit
MPDPLLRVQDLVVEYPARHGHQPVRAVAGVTFELHQGETLGLVGESGCGKSTVSRAITQLVRPSAGRVLLRRDDGEVDLCTLGGELLRQVRRDVQMVFQDPFSSLDPRLTAAAIVAEPLRCFGEVKATALDRASELLALVGIDPQLGGRYPHEFSGGQRQRIGLARALALKPRLLICDEPVSALDVSIQAQVLNLLVELRAKLGLTMLFISHDLAVVRHLADRVAVMQAGLIVELADADRLYTAPEHAYTRQLLAAVPRLPVASGSVPG